MDSNEMEFFVPHRSVQLKGTCGKLALRSQSWCPDKIERLADLVQPFPCLYDKRDKDFKDTALKTAIWEDIGAQLECAGHEAMRKWMVQRDRYHKERQLVETSRKSEDGTHVYQPKWRIYSVIERVLGGVVPNGKVWKNIASLQNANTDLDLRIRSPMEEGLHQIECDLNDSVSASEENSHNSFMQVIPKPSGSGLDASDTSCPSPPPPPMTSTAAPPVVTHRVNPYHQPLVQRRPGPLSRFVARPRRPFDVGRPSTSSAVRLCSPQQQHQQQSPSATNIGGSVNNKTRTVQIDLNRLLKAHQAVTSEGDEINYFCRRLELRLRQLDKSDQRSAMRAIDTHMYDLEGQDKYNNT